MIENLARHIEWLLGENDCVIVPGLGGFIAHYTPARRIEAENRFLPPTRIIAFNPRLKINDGVLVQSYMQVEGVSWGASVSCVILCGAYIASPPSITTWRLPPYMVWGVLRCWN